MYQGFRRLKTMLIVDLDEVLADFTTAAAEAHGLSRVELEARRDPGVWHIKEAIGVTSQQFWEPINQLGEAFWTSLKPLPWFEDLLALLKQVNCEWYIATTPSFELGSYTGKLKWIAEYLPNKLHHVFVTHHKHVLANEDRYLIDDSEKNVEKFAEEGGVGILFAHRGNCLHEFADDPVTHLVKQLDCVGLL
jgi:5'(3')-deoxyribonucleotidase